MTISNLLALFQIKLIKVFYLQKNHPQSQYIAKRLCNTNVYKFIVILVEPLSINKATKDTI